jgi:DNA modification methylase
MEIRKIPIEKLNPAAYNPRKDLQPGDPEYEKLKRSIQEFGYVEPIIWNKRTGNIVGGHQRYKVLLDMGAEEIDCVVVDLDETKEKALNIALNKIQGDWDYLKLEDLLQELDTGEFDIELTGFDMVEIEDLMTQFHEPEEIIEDEVPEPPEEPITKPGDLWILGRHRLLCGDATKKEDVERLMDGKKADSMITDPPYGVDYSGKNEFLNKFDKGNCIQKPIDNDAITDYRKFFSDFMGLAPLAEYNTVYIFMSSKELHSLRLALDDCGYSWGDYLVWVKNNHVLGRKDYNAKHEFIVYGWKGKHKFYGGFSTTVLEFDRPLRSDLHPTMKPIPLLAKLINDGSPAKGKVYDPFGGSGSTLIACEQLNRICYMMELDPIYCDVIIKRWENLTGQKAVLAE